MYDFILETSLFLSLGVVIYMIARAIPRVDESGEAIHVHGRFDRFLAKLPLHAIDNRLNGFFEKTLRRVRVFLLRTDRVIDERLDKLKKTDTREQGADLFEKITNSNDEEQKEK